MAAVRSLSSKELCWSGRYTSNFLHNFSFCGAWTCSQRDALQNVINGKGIAAGSVRVFLDSQFLGKMQKSWSQQKGSWLLSSGWIFFLAGYKFLICDHMRAVHLYVSALKHSCPIVAFPCASHQDFLNGHCLDCADPFLFSCPRIGEVPACFGSLWGQWETVLFSGFYGEALKAHVLHEVEH